MPSASPSNRRANASLDSADRSDRRSGRDSGTERTRRCAIVPRILPSAVDSTGCRDFPHDRPDRRRRRPGPASSSVPARNAGRSGRSVSRAACCRTCRARSTRRCFRTSRRRAPQFDAGEFVAVQGKGNLFNQRVELIVDRIRRVIPVGRGRRISRGRLHSSFAAARRRDVGGARERVSPASKTPPLRQLLERVVERHGDRLRIWPAARQVHHAYRSGLLEHVLKIMEIAVVLADATACGATWSSPARSCTTSASSRSSPTTRRSTTRSRAISSGTSSSARGCCAILLARCAWAVRPTWRSNSST